MFYLKICLALTHSSPFLSFTPYSSFLTSLLLPSSLLLLTFFVLFSPCLPLPISWLPLSCLSVCVSVKLKQTLPSLALYRVCVCVCVCVVYCLCACALGQVGVCVCVCVS